MKNLYVFVSSAKDWFDFLRCEELVLNFHKCEDSVPVPHTCKELVLNFHKCEESVPNPHICEKLVPNFVDHILP